jgi:hypothetical protein
MALLRNRVGNKEFNPQASGTNVHFEICMADKQLTEVSQYAKTYTFLELFVTHKFQNTMTPQTILRTEFLIQESL